LPQGSVLIVNDSSDDREVLRLALSRGGTRVFEAETADLGLQIASREHPDVIVLDLEGDEESTDPALASRWDEAAAGGETKIVVLATARRQTRGLSRGEFFAKPYHFGPLIHKIEEILRDRQAAGR